jgi:transglutaminase-like putative cysteine protease
MLQALQRLPARREITDSENSLLLRILIQSLVTVGIMATDVAAETHMSLWAVPVSMIGAFWSWRQRQRSQIAIKFALSAAMLAALAYFFQHLLGSLNDTRLVLAELLVQIQAIHTFDMPKRKDLGYSILIGLILVAVAATLSQTMAFAPMLLLFLAIALPVMLLDYRSRLGLVPVASGQQVLRGAVAQLPFKNLGQLLGIIVILGLLVFTMMPRLPGYQLQSMPVSQDLPSISNYTGQQITNPGYKKSKKGKKLTGTGQHGAGSGGGTEEDGTKFDETSYYGFNQQINQNLRGELKPQLVMRVRSQSPGFWRVLAFDKYTGQGWEISHNDDVQKVKRSGWSNKFSLALKTSQAPIKQIIQSYTAVTELPNVLPALMSPADVYFPTQDLAIDREDSLRSPVGLAPDLTYTVMSVVPERRVDLLTKAGNRFDRYQYARENKEFQKSLPDYLQIPANLQQKLQPFTEEIIANYPKTQISKNPEPLTNNYDTALYLAQYLKQHYQTPTNPQQLPLVPDGQDLADWFLFRCEKAQTACVPGGYPDHFSTTYTMMLRSIGIPARLAVGFDPGYFNPFTGMYEVKNTDAHALTEVYFPKYGWYSFDPIPTHPLFPPSVEDDQTFSVLQQIWKWVAGLLPSPVTAWIATIWGYVALVVIVVWNFLVGSWLGAFVALAMVIALAFGGWLLWKSFRRWRYQRWLQRQPPMEQIYQQLLQRLNLIWPKQQSQTPGEYLVALGEYADPLMMATAQPIVVAYVAWRYGHQLPAIDYLRSLLQDIQRAKV